MREHEYSVVGHSRSRIGLHVAILSGAIASLLTVLVQAILFHLARSGRITLPEVVIWPVTAVTIFGALFFLFDRFGWRLFGLRTLVGVPDISGRWDIEGQSYNTDNHPTYAWEGRMDITQKYERICIHLRTKTSGSHSVSAAIVPEGRTGYRLIYSYRNEPKPGQPELKSHIGHCEVLFEPGLQEAEGSYFNSGGRLTLGTMKLKRNPENG